MFREICLLKLTMYSSRVEGFLKKQPIIHHVVPNFFLTRNFKISLFNVVSFRASQSLGKVKFVFFFQSDFEFGPAVIYIVGLEGFFINTFQFGRQGQGQVCRNLTTTACEPTYVIPALHILISHDTCLLSLLHLSLCIRATGSLSISANIPARLVPP